MNSPLYILRKVYVFKYCLGAVIEINMIIQEIVEQSFFGRNIESFIAGFVTSVFFLFILSRLKPKLRICNKISIEEREGSIHFGFKIINKSWFFKVYDLRVKLYSIELIPSENNEDLHYDELSLRKDNTWFLNRFNIYHCFQDLIFKDRRLKKRTDYAVQFFTKENLTDLVDLNKRIRFEVLAKHSLSGFSVVKVYTFRHKNDLILGSFLSGNTPLIKK
ncbi:MAG: hypothetical protein JKY22_00990 [Flavobacteriaceae bacterium]|nr:hypothetical protein [Flavobacteriaceae bacterium]